MMSDMAGSDARCSNMSESTSSEDSDHNQQQQQQQQQEESAAILPEYSQQPVVGVDILPQAPPAGAPPRYEHPPPYGPVGWTPDRGAVVNVGVQRVPPDSTVAAARRRYMLSRSPGGATSSSSCHIALACIVFWLCGCLFGAIAFLLAVMSGHTKSTSQSRHLLRASWLVSLTGIVVGAILIIPMYAVFYPGQGICGTSDLSWNDTAMWPEPKTTRPPEVTSSLLCPVVVGNETTCFRFASSVTARRCSELGGVFVNVSSYNSSSSSSSSSSSPAAGASISSTLCYHNVCRDYDVENACFQYRTTHLDREGCHSVKGYYVVSRTSGRSCYYNDCPGHEASNGKCYRARDTIPAAACHGFYENGFCYYD